MSTTPKADFNHHISSQFNENLQDVNTQFMTMGGLVEQQVANAIQALLETDVALALKVQADDQLVNTMETQIDEALTLILARRHPAARDLRMVIAISKANTDLERIGDEASKIARFAISIHEANRAWSTKFSDVKAMSTVTQTMLRMALNAFARSDETKVQEIAQMDEKVDEQYQAAIRQMITFMLEDPRTISMTLEVLFVAKAIERIGDHAKNISEYVVYMVKGKDVRHIIDEDHIE